MKVVVVAVAVVVVEVVAVARLTPSILVTGEEVEVVGATDVV